MNEATRSPSPAGPANAAPRTAPVPAARAGRRRAAWLWALSAVGAVLAVYLVGRGFAELILINYGDPASYANDWGGPSLAGVFAVHSGPAAAIIAATVWWAVRHRRGGRQILPWWGQATQG